MENREIKEIDLVALMRSIWDQRRFVVKVAGIVLAIGLFVALFSATKYTASTKFVPQMGQKSSGGGLQGLAALAGVSLGGGAEGAEMLSPMVYPTVVSSVSFQKELMYSTITVDGQQVAIVDYFTDDRYRRFSLIEFIAKYTIGLPGLIFSKRDEETTTHEDSQGGIVKLSRRENLCMKRLQRDVTVTVKEKDGFVTLAAVMPEARMAAELAQRATDLLQSYVTRFKLERAAANLAFIEERQAEAREEFERAQRALASWRDSNRDLSSSIARTREERLSNDNDLAFSIYSELSRQREQAAIKVKEDTPIFTVLEPVSEPLLKSAPKRVFILGVSLFLGLFAGVGLAVVLPWLKSVLKK